MCGLNDSWKQSRCGSQREAKATTTRITKVGVTCEMTTIFDHFKTYVWVSGSNSQQVLIKTMAKIKISHGQNLILDH